MDFSHDTEMSLGMAVDLVNSRLDDTELLPDLAALEAFLDRHSVSGRRRLGPADLAAVRALRPRLRAVWAAADDARTAAAIVNGLLAESHALPQLTEHDGFDLHLHFTPADAPVAQRVAADGAMALADVLRSGERGRLRGCAAPGCAAVLVDLSRNRSRRYCDTGNCGNRQHVAAYRARLRAVDS